MKAGRAGLESHFAALLKGTPFWGEYKSRLISFASSGVSSQFDTAEGDDYFRVKIRDILPRLLYLFCAHGLVPSMEARMLMPQKEVLLQREASFVPSFSFTLDSLATTTYWGKREAILAPSFWKARRISSAIAVAPSDIEYSLASLIWPHRILNFAIDGEGKEMRDLAKDYVFNVLLPPTFVKCGSYCPFYGAALISISDKCARIVALHKVVFFAERDTNRSDLYRATFISSDLQVKRVACKACFGEEPLRERCISDGLIVAEVKISNGRYIRPRFFLYPYKHPALGEEFGVTLTLLSTALRMAYLGSENPVFIPTYRVELLLRKMLLLFSKLHVSVPKDVAAWLMERSGIAKVAEYLGVYAIADSGVAYLHPYIIEAIVKIFGGIEKIPDRLSSSLIPKVAIKVAELIKKSERHLSFAKRLEVADWLRKELEVSGFASQKILINALLRLKNVFRLTKVINCPPEIRRLYKAV